jgi:hypothetical protein
VPVRRARQGDPVLRDCVRGDRRSGVVGGVRDRGGAARARWSARPARADHGAGDRDHRGGPTRRPTSTRRRSARRICGIVLLVAARSSTGPAPQSIPFASRVRCLVALGACRRGAALGPGLLAAGPASNSSLLSITSVRASFATRLAALLSDAAGGRRRWALRSTRPGCWPPPASSRPSWPACALDARGPRSHDCASPSWFVSSRSTPCGVVPFVWSTGDHAGAVMMLTRSVTLGFSVGDDCRAPFGPPEGSAAPQSARPHRPSTHDAGRRGLRRIRSRASVRSPRWGPWARPRRRS